MADVTEEEDPDLTGIDDGLLLSRINEHLDDADEDGVWQVTDWDDEDRLLGTSTEDHPMDAAEDVLTRMSSGFGVWHQEREGRHIIVVTDDDLAEDLYRVAVMHSQLTIGLTDGPRVVHTDDL